MRIKFYHLDVVQIMESVGVRYVVSNTSVSADSLNKDSGDKFGHKSKFAPGNVDGQRLKSCVPYCNNSN